MENQWKNITVEESAKIRAVLNDSEATQEEKMIRLAAIVQGVSEDTILNLPLNQASEVFAMVWGLDTPPRRNKTRRIYQVGDWELKVTDANDMSVAQWVDFQTYGKDMEKNMVEVLSCALVPKGKKYNDGYDIEKLKEDLKGLPVCDALAVCFFFQKRWLKSMRRILNYLVGWSALKGRKARPIMKAALQTRAEVSDTLRSL